MMLIGAILLLMAPSVAQESFSFFKFFQGEWDVVRSSADFKSMDQMVEHERMGHYTIAAMEGSTNRLGGTYYENDTATGEITSEFSIFVEMQEPSSGVFKTGPSEGESQVLFAFDFMQQSNDHIFSHGEWAGETGAFYQFAISSPTTFVITVFPKQGKNSAKAKLYMGKKRVVVEEKSLFQQYGTMMMMMVVFIFVRRMGSGMAAPKQE